MSTWCLHPALAPWRRFIKVDPNHGLGFEELVNRHAGAPIDDAVTLDRSRVIAQLKLLRELHNAGCLIVPDHAVPLPRKETP